MDEQQLPPVIPNTVISKPTRFPIIAMAVLFVAVAGYFASAYYFTLWPFEVSVAPVPTFTPRPSSAQKPNNPEIVRAQISDDTDAQYFEINIADKTKTLYDLSSDELSKENILKYQGIIQEENTTKTSRQVSRIFPSIDKSKLIVVFSTYDTTQEPSEFDGSLPTLKEDEFLCIVAMHQCNSVNILSSADSEVLGGVWWFHWDSSKNFLIGHLSGEGIGSAAPVVIYDINTKIVRKTISYDYSSQDRKQRAEVPQGAFSPSLGQFVMVVNTTKPVMLLLYKIEDLTKPARTYDITSILKEDAGKWAEGVNSVLWSDNEKQLIYGSDSEIYSINLEDDKISLIYTDTTRNSSYLYWDRNILQFSPSRRYLLFVDYDGYPSEWISILKAIDLQNNNQVIELARAKYISIIRD